MDHTNLIFRSLADIEENIHEKLTVESLAVSIHLSKFHYQRMFREAVGDSVMRYVTRRKLSLAAKDLAETDDSILEIALKYGYDSHEGFTRSFRAHTGVSPKEYRKYHLSINSPQTQKERNAMFYSKTTDEIIQTLNNMIVQIKETAAYTRQSKATAEGDAAAFYSGFWEAIAANADVLGDELAMVLNRVSDIPRRPDEISARFLIVKAIEDTAFKANIMAFQIRLFLARAKPEHRAAYEPICGKYVDLARNVQIKVSKIVEFFNELSSLIFQDMRKNGTRKLQDAIAAGNMAARKLSEDATLPYRYIADEIDEITKELSSLSLEDISISVLEDYLFRLDIIASAADLDILRMPAHKPLLEGIHPFKKQLEEAVSFFQNLSEDVIGGMTKSGQEIPLDRTTGKKYSDLAFQNKILLFYLKGEIQKLGEKLSPEQKAGFDNICKKMNLTIQLANCAGDETSPWEIAEILQWVYRELTTIADSLGLYGSPIRFIGEEIMHLANHLS